jgi:hypothetical protein
MKELDEENRCPKKMYMEERVKVEIVEEALTKNGSAISTAGDGAVGHVGAVSHDQAGVQGIWYQPNLIPVQGQAGSEKRSHCGLAGAADEQPTYLRLRAVFHISA